VLVLQSNILVDRKGVPVLVDFGLLSFAHSGRDLVRGEGTERYMAPELLLDCTRNRGETAGSSLTPVDVYAWGASLFHVRPSSFPPEHSHMFVGALR
jgi:serine/threonine protein kinase